MIIKSLRAENVLKYTRLELAEIPANGIIAISGPNESGKSTIGETLCFALFGRTFSLAGNEMDKMIRWGAAHCNVACDFLVGDRAYRLNRYLDKEGNHSARLSRDGEEEPFAKGVEAVEEAMFDLLGFEYDEFIESFYLAQREITKPHPHSYAVKIMAGLASVEFVLSELDREIAADRTVVEEKTAEQARVHAEIAVLAVDPDHLGRLEEERNRLLVGEEAGRNQMSELKKSLAAYQEAIPKIRKGAGQQSTAVFLQLVSLALAGLAGGGWWLLSGKAGSGGLVDLLMTLFSGWEGHALHALYAAGGALGLFLIFHLRYWVSRLRVRVLRRRGQTLASDLDRLMVHARQPELRTLLEEDALAEPSEEHPRVDFNETACLNLRGEVSGCRASADRAGSVAGDASAWLRYVVNAQRRKAAGVERLIEKEKANRARLKELEGALPLLGKVLAGHQDRIQLRSEARELLVGAGRHMSKRFNMDLRDLAGRTLPLFTEGRYDHLQIDDQLNVRVFSSEKRDYMDLEEISSGTQRQIMLAVRLALAQQMVKRAVVGRQFAFLDEPFAFFDQERTRGSLKVLRNLSDDISQIWVVAQEFPVGVEFDLEIHCARENTALDGVKPVAPD